MFCQQSVEPSPCLIIMAGQLRLARGGLLLLAACVAAPGGRNRCAVIEGWDLTGNDLLGADGKPSPQPVADPGACCDLCASKPVAQRPQGKCGAWSFNHGTKTCWMKTKNSTHPNHNEDTSGVIVGGYDPCVGNSSALAPAECAAWQDLYDGIGLAGNKGGMAHSRLQPCGSMQGGGGGVTCKDGHITHIEVFPSEYPHHPHGGHLPMSLVHLTRLEHLVLFCHGLVGPVPPLNFSAINNGCAIHDPMGSKDCYTENGKIFADNPNNFSCPLPAGAAEHCHAKCDIPSGAGPPPPP